MVLSQIRKLWFVKVCHKQQAYGMVWLIAEEQENITFNKHNKNAESRFFERWYRGMVDAI